MLTYAAEGRGTVLEAAVESGNTETFRGTLKMLQQRLPAESRTGKVIRGSGRDGRKVSLD